MSGLEVALALGVGHRRYGTEHTLNSIGAPAVRVNRIVPNVPTATA
jgi:hypothetical protein